MVLLREPVTQVAGSIKLAALIVKAVADLMSDDRANAAVVDRVVGLRIEERGLQNRSRKHDLVHLRIVIGVDRLRRHLPLAPIDGLAELADFVAIIEARRAHDVPHEIVAHDLQG